MYLNVIPISVGLFGDFVCPICSRLHKHAKVLASTECQCPCGAVLELKEEERSRAMELQKTHLGSPVGKA